MKGKVAVLASMAGLLMLAATLRAEVPERLHYQGRLVEAGTNYHGAATLKFSLVDGGMDVSMPATAFAMVMNGAIDSVFVMGGGSGYAGTPDVTVEDTTGAGAILQAQVSDEGAVTNIVIANGGHDYTAPSVTVASPPPLMTYTTYWSNDGTPSGEPVNGVAVTVTRGLFSLLLGDTSLANMLPVPATVFNVPDVYVRVWADTGTGFQQLAPDQRMAAVGYAMQAASVAYGAIGEAEIEDGSITAWDIGIDQVMYWNIADNAVYSNNIANGSISFADIGQNGAASGQVPKWNGSAWAPANDLTTGGGVLAGYKENGTFVPSPQAAGADAIALGQGTSAGASRSVVGGGSYNAILGGATNAVISGGYLNDIASGAMYATVGGGYDNNVGANAWAALIGGGVVNGIGTNAIAATVAGGKANTIAANADYAAILGGEENEIQDADNAVIGGGVHNQVQIRAKFSTISGGLANVIENNCTNCVIGGGRNNRVRSDSRDVVIAGGKGNTAYDTYGSAIGGGCDNEVEGMFSMVGGGSLNAVLFGGTYSSIGGGNGNAVDGVSAVIGGGTQNFVSRDAGGSVIGGGSGNTASEGYYAFIGGGVGNRIGNSVREGTCSVLGGGYSNSVDGAYGVVGGGSKNTIEEAYYATIPGGDSCSAAAGAHYAFAAGRRAQAEHAGAFVLADSQNSDFASTMPDSFNARFSGGYKLTGGAIEGNGSGLTGVNAATVGGVALSKSSMYVVSVDQEVMGGSTVQITVRARDTNDIPIAGFCWPEQGWGMTITGYMQDNWTNVNARAAYWAYVYNPDSSPHSVRTQLICIDVP
ncbi:MAG: hypothetical protein WCK89_01775 [bacterium]